MKYEDVFKPIKIGNLTINNRFVMPAMESGMTKNHYFTEQSMAYFLARAKGGFGLIITDYMAIDQYGIGVPDEAGLWDDKFIKPLQKLTDLIHENSCTKIFAQLHHSGMMCVQKTTGVPPKGPSAIAASNYIEKITPYTKNEVYELIEHYGDAAYRAKQAGFDGIELQACHGYLIAQFLSKYFNKRVDEFGGNYKNRFRFAEMAIKSIKNKCGIDFPIIIRLSAEEFLESGNSIDDACIYAQMAENAGVDAIDLSTGTGIGGNIVTPHYFQPGFNINNTVKLKQFVKIPVIAVGRINDPILVQSIIENNMADMVALGRQSICDPEFPIKMKTNREDEIFHCTGCMQRCYYSKGCEENDIGVSCMQNPFSGKENSWTIHLTDNPKNISIIGAGPAGLEAAWILAKRGHHVDIYEKNTMAGGNFRLAAIPPRKQDVANVIYTYSYLCEKYGVNIHYHENITEDKIKKLDTDIIILATGAKPLIPNIDGVHKYDNIITANDVLNGKAIIANEKILILGGGLVGCETAEFLHNYNNDITIVDMVDGLAKEQVKRSRTILIERLEHNNTHIFLNTKVSKIYHDGILANQDDKEIKIDGFSKIILALGYQSDNTLDISTLSSNKKTYIIGDAKKARDAKIAIYEAAKLAMSI